MKKYHNPFIVAKKLLNIYIYSPYKPKTEKQGK